MTGSSNIAAEKRTALPGRLDLAAAVALRSDFVDHAGDLILDASDVSLITTPALQLLMALRDRQAARGDELRIASPSDEFLACIRTLGVRLNRIQT